jgi:acyl-CoA reductase-like NAD-dependent aldehyde dehydrogenase
VGAAALKPRGDYIRGRFVKSRRAAAAAVSMDPGDLDRPKIEFPSFEDAPERALSAAQEAQPAWGALPLAARVAALQKLRAELRNRGEELIATVAAETGRPLWEVRSEARAMHGFLDGVLNQGLAELALHPAPPGTSVALFRPLGVVVVLAPSSQPAYLLHADAIAAMAAGCTVVCKPSELTPATGQIYAEIVSEADLPRGVFNLVQGDASTGAALARSPLTQGVLFAGSEANGQKLLEAARDGERVVRTLLSGQAAAIVLDDANLDEAAYKIAVGACAGAGQRCTSTRRVIAHRRIADVLTSKLLHLLQHLKVGHGSDPQSFMGPLIRESVVEEFLAELRRIGGHGSQELVAGAPLTTRRRGSYVTPGLFRVSAEGMAAIAEHETIGPVLTLATVDELDEAVELANRTPLRLGLSVFCRSEEEAAKVRERSEFGLCLHNLPTTKWPTKLPVWPRGRSGNGLPAGTSTVRVCTRLAVGLASEEALDLTMLPPGLPRDL